MLLVALSLALSLVACGLVLLGAYLVVLTSAALIGKPSVPAGDGRSRRFAILVPAHNEQALIGRLLANLAELDYPPSHVDVCVVADNCDDSTATIAQALGTRVYERFSEGERSKGHALRWLLARLREERSVYDGYVILDADSVVAGNFLRSMNARLAAGSQAIQAYYSVLNAVASPLAGVRFAALAAIHYLRPIGRLKLGLSCGLKGNGMCFSAAVIDRFAWNWFTLAEDVEFHLALVSAGIRVDFAPETYVLADMPINLAQARSQNQRWERGRLDLVRQYVPRLIRDGLRSRSALQLDAAIEQLIPPLSVPLALSIGCLLLAAPLGLALPTVLAAASLGIQVGYLLVAMALVRAPLAAYRALAYAPVYVVWKLGVYLQAMLGSQTNVWVRTARFPGEPA